MPPPRRDARVTLLSRNGRGQVESGRFRRAERSVSAATSWPTYKSVHDMTPEG